MTFVVYFFKLHNYQITELPNLLIRGKDGFPDVTASHKMYPVLTAGLRYQVKIRPAGRKLV